MVFTQHAAQQPDQPNLAFYIEQIRTFPATIAKHFWQRTLRVDQIDTELVADGQLTFVTTEKLEAAIQIGMQQLQLKHNALADWLRYYLLNDTQLPLLDTWKSHYKPLADVQLARLKVCQEMWAEPELQLHFSSPAHLWAEWLLSETLVVTNTPFQGETCVA